jgi:hypothetical protein
MLRYNCSGIIVRERERRTSWELIGLYLKIRLNKKICVSIRGLSVCIFVWAGNAEGKVTSRVFSGEIAEIVYMLEQGYLHKK